MSILLCLMKQYRFSKCGKTSGGLITIFRMKLRKFSETVLQFDHFHSNYNIFNNKTSTCDLLNLFKSGGFSEIVLQYVCALIKLNGFSGTIS